MFRIQWFSREKAGFWRAAKNVDQQHRRAGPGGPAAGAVFRQAGGPDKYRVLEGRRRRAQIAARRMLDRLDAASPQAKV